MKSREKDNSKSRQDIILTSSAPVADGGRSFNFLYWIGAILGFVCGIALGVNAGGIAAVVLFFLCLMWLVKNVVCYFPLMNLRNWTFHCGQNLPYDQLITVLQPGLLPLGMTIEKNKEGAPVISYRHMIYDIRYESDHTFSIWWRKSLAGALILTNLDTSRYRKACVAYGLIGYAVQQAEKEAT